MSPQMSTESADEHIRLDRLREAIQANRVSFPTPTPVFECQHRADIQWRLVELYFVRGWSCSRLGERYQVTPTRIQQLLRGWVKRALALGFLQTIPAEDNREGQVFRAWEEPDLIEMPVGALLPPGVFATPDVEKRAD